MKCVVLLGKSRAVESCMGCMGLLGVKHRAPVQLPTCRSAPADAGSSSRSKRHAPAKWYCLVATCPDHCPESSQGWLCFDAMRAQLLRRGVKSSVPPAAQRTPPRDNSKSHSDSGFSADDVTMFTLLSRKGSLMRLYRSGQKTPVEPTQEVVEEQRRLAPTSGVRVVSSPRTSGKTKVAQLRRKSALDYAGPRSWHSAVAETCHRLCGKVAFEIKGPYIGPILEPTQVGVQTKNG